MITNSELLDAAIAGKDWPTAAAAILASPSSTRLSRETLTPLGKIAWGIETDRDPAKLIGWVAPLIKILEGER